MDEPRLAPGQVREQGLVHKRVLEPLHVQEPRLIQEPVPVLLALATRFWICSCGWVN